MPFESALRDGPGAGYELIETLRFEAGEFVRIDRHMARLGASARDLGFRFDRQAVMSALDSLRRGPAVQRVRLSLSREGRVAAAGTAFSPLPAETVWRLAIAQTRLSSQDPLLRHKTTQRAIYDAARAELSPDEADEILLLNEKGEICEGSITSLFADFGDGVLTTPALSCGLLAGVLRAELLEREQAREGFVTPDRLVAATALYVGNSLRGLIRARLRD